MRNLGALILQADTDTDTESSIFQGFDLIWVDIWEKQKKELGSILLSGSVFKKISLGN